MKRVKTLKEEFPSIIDRAYVQFKKRRFVQDIMSKDVVTITLKATMAEASRIMGANRIGSLIVEIGGKAEGIVTERDLLSKVLAKGKDPEGVSVKEVMSSPLIAIGPTATIKEAAQTMISKKGRLAVFKEGTLIGIITAADLVKSLPEISEARMKIDDVMSKRVIMVPENTSVEDVTKIMGKKRIGSVIVTKDGSPLEYSPNEICLQPFLPEVNPSAQRLEMQYQKALKHIRRLPIIKDDEMVGIVTARDLVEAYAK